jgi:cytochrome c556
MLRPPHNAGEAAWLDRAAELRTSATRLARAASNRDFPRSRAHMHEVAAACNRCHRTFRIDFRLNPFEDKPPAPAR